MKKLFTFNIFVISLLFALTNINFAQWQNCPNDPNSIYFNGNLPPNTGNVGIGDFSGDNPLYKLHVKGDMFSTGNVYWNNGNSFLSSDPNGAIELGYNNIHSKTPYIDFHYGTAFGGEDFNTRIINSANNQLDFVTSNTINKMSIKKLADHNNTLEFDNTSGKLGIEFWTFGINDKNDKNINHLLNKNGLSSTNGIIDFYADYNDPAHNQLSIRSDNSVTWGGDDQNYLSADQGGSIHLNTYGLADNVTPYIDFTFGHGLNTQHIDARIKNSAANTLDFWTDMDLNGNGGTKVMTLTSMAVYAKRLIVQLTWSDFVFKSAYKLKSLDEVEKYIKENGHLEGIPSEEKVSENGVELGEMTSKLLQKIEELTLYIIEQNKRIEKLEMEKGSQ